MLTTALDELLVDEGKSEAVFDAYQAVCLSRSKDLGPRVIAILTAELVLASATSDRFDDLVFSAAEELLDSELSEFSDFAISHEMKVTSNCGEKTRRLDDGSLEIPMGEETTDSNWIAGSSVPIGPMDLARDIGNWAPKLKRLGLVSDDVRGRLTHLQFCSHIFRISQHNSDSSKNSTCSLEPTGERYPRQQRIESR